jgi:DNA-binding SARP family transcriptional activator
VAEAAAETNEAEAGLAAARRLVALEPLDESARRSLMQLLARSGNRAEALRQYQVCESLLRDELGVAPDEETRKRSLDIKADEAGPARAGWRDSG